MFSLVPVRPAVEPNKTLQDSFWIACESDSGELPAFFGTEEISISPAMSVPNDHSNASRPP